MSQGPSRKRVMALDDDADNLELYRAALGDEHDVLTLKNPMDAYELIDFFEPDLLLLDIMMPKLSGYQLLEVLQRHPRAASMPVIVVSAKTAEGDMRHAYRLGAKLMVPKPVGPERLARLVRAQLDAAAPAPKSMPTKALFTIATAKPWFRNGDVHMAGPGLITA